MLLRNLTFSCVFGFMNEYLYCHYTYNEITHFVLRNKVIFDDTKNVFLVMEMVINEKAVLIY